MPNSPQLKLNIGSGQRPFGNQEWKKWPPPLIPCAICGIVPGTHLPENKHPYIPENEWINVDAQERWSPDVVADGAYMPMFPDGSADMIVLHHVLEHAGCGESAPMLKECFRILAPGGSLIVCVPEMRELAKMWLRGTLDTQVYMTNVYGAYMTHEADRHKWGFDSLSLATYLMSVAPWAKVTTFNWREIPGADIAKDIWICGIECTK